MTTINQRLISLRNSRGFTQSQVAEKLDVKRARYNAWEQGISQPNLEMVQRLAELFNVSSDYLIGRTDMKNAEIDRTNVLDPDFRVIQRAAMDMDPEQRKKAIEMWDLLFRDVIDKAKKQEGVNQDEEKES